MIGLGAPQLNQTILQTMLLLFPAIVKVIKACVKEFTAGIYPKQITSKSVIAIAEFTASNLVNYPDFPFKTSAKHGG